MTTSRTLNIPIGLVTQLLHYKTLKKKIFFNVYLFLRQRERQSMNRGGAEREGDTESETGSRL